MIIVTEGRIEIQKRHLIEILSFHGLKIFILVVLGCDAVTTCRWVPPLQWNLRAW
jgi:hypothetical protein